MPSRAPLRAVFFDLDDTLCDTIGTREARARRAFQLLAPAIPDLRETEFVKLVMEPTGDRIVRGVTAVVESLGLAKSPAGRAAAAASWLDLLCLMPGARQTLDTLRETYLLGIITNGDSELQRAKCSALALAIEPIVISGDYGFEKPDPRIFQKACSLAGVAQAESVYVGDRIDVDVAGARAAGMRAIWFSPLPRGDAIAINADGVITRFDELPDVLRKLS